MCELETAWAAGITRRKAFRALVGFVAGSPLLRSQQDPFRDHSRIPSLDEMVTAFQALLEWIQTDLARYMVMCGLVNIEAITRAAVTVHRR
jgi:hypothetical protein